MIKLSTVTLATILTGNALADTTLPTLAAPVVNVDALSTAIADMGFEARLRKDGVLEVDLGDGARFVGKFSAHPYKSGANGSAECGSVVLEERASWARNPPGAKHFVAICANGTHQDILPVVDNPAFYNLLSNSNLQYSAFSRYGSLQLPAVDVFYADHTIRPLLPADQQLLESSNDPSGVVLRIHSENADGSINYEVLTPTGKQIFYGGQETMVEGDFIRNPALP